MKWNFKSGLPIYTQIVEQMKMRIAQGIYKPGDRIPPVRDLAMEAAVNPNTMQRALLELEREGLFYTERTNGRFVTHEEGVLTVMREKASQEYVNDLFENLLNMGFTKEEIVLAVEKWSKEVEK